MRGEDIFEDLDATQTDELWRPEFASYMLEGTPGQPYGSTLKDLLKVEKVRVTICGRFWVDRFKFKIFETSNGFFINIRFERSWPI